MGGGSIIITPGSLCSAPLKRRGGWNRIQIAKPFTHHIFNARLHYSLGLYTRDCVTAAEAAEKTSNEASRICTLRDNNEYCTHSTQRDVRTSVFPRERRSIWLSETLARVKEHSERNAQFLLVNCTARACAISRVFLSKYECLSFSLPDTESLIKCHSLSAKCMKPSFLTSNTLSYSIWAKTSCSAVDDIPAVSRRGSRYSVDIWRFCVWKKFFFSLFNESVFCSSQ